MFMVNKKDQNKICVKPILRSLKDFTKLHLIPKSKLLSRFYSAYKNYHRWRWRRTEKKKIKIVQHRLLQPSSFFPLFNFIEIETQNKCNGTCSFCPVNRHIDPRPFRRMDEALFDSILKQLKELSFCGFLSLFSNNEPLLDDRIEFFLGKARKELPTVKLFLITNGTLLTTQLLDRLMPHLDRLIINDYVETLEFTEHIKEINRYCRAKNFYEGKVIIYLRDKNAVLTSRGGNAPNKKVRRTTRVSCILPFIQFIVRSDGKISLCCNDALAQFTLGDLTKEKILDVWNNKLFFEIRNKLFHQGRGSVFLCKRCDSITQHINFFSNEGLFENNLLHLN